MAVGFGGNENVKEYGSSGFYVAPARVAGDRNPHAGWRTCGSVEHHARLAPGRPYRGWALRCGSPWDSHPWLQPVVPTGLRPALLDPSLNTLVMPQKTQLSRGQGYPSHKKAGIHRPGKHPPDAASLLVNETTADTRFDQAVLHSPQCEGSEISREGLTVQCQNVF